VSEETHGGRGQRESPCPATGRAPGQAHIHRRHRSHHNLDNPLPLGKSHRPPWPSFALPDDSKRRRMNSLSVKNTCVPILFGTTLALAGKLSTAQWSAKSRGNLGRPLFCHKLLLVNRLRCRNKRSAKMVGMDTPFWPTTFAGQPCSQGINPDLCYPGGPRSHLSR
jgi:hypothetical protein